MRSPVFHIDCKRDPIRSKKRPVARQIKHHFKHARKSEFPHYEREPHKHDASVTSDLLDNVHESVRAKIRLVFVLYRINDIRYQHKNHDNRTEYVDPPEFHSFTSSNGNLPTYQNAFHISCFIMCFVYFQFFFFRTTHQYFDL